jgi:mRNA interferase MazF
MKKGEVWLINLDPTLGAEIHKTRPGVIVSSDLMGALPLKIVVPLTAWKEAFKAAPGQVKIKKTAENGLEKTSSADPFQVRSISERRLGRLASGEMDLIESSLAVSLGMI